MKIKEKIESTLHLIAEHRNILHVYGLYPFCFLEQPSSEQERENVCVCVREERTGNSKDSLVDVFMVWFFKEQCPNTIFGFWTDFVKKGNINNTDI